MAIRKPKSVRRRRGSRTHGYGRIGQHRKAGQRGGKGKTGGKKHDWTYVTAHDPDRFGKHGFRRPPTLLKRPRTINVGDIALHLDRFTEGTTPPKDATIPINLTEYGYDKVLGSGSITIPLAITAPVFTQRAAQKIKAAGGSTKGTVQAPAKEKTPKAEPDAKAKPKTEMKEKSKARPKTKTTTKAKPAAKPKASEKSKS
ncbi:MAG: uL15 family ribosomal protein [Promethearchaeota archaeon]